MGIDQSNTPADKRSLALVPFERVARVLEPYPDTHYHHLVPSVHQEPSPLFRPAVAIIKVDATDDRDCYPVPGSGKRDMAACGPNDLVVLHAGVLERIGNAVGIDWAETRFEHNHAKEANLCVAKVNGWFVDPLGSRRMLTASAKSDLRDGGPVAAFLKGAALGVARQFICERTESRARNRAIRKVANLRSSYKKAELAKPFLALRWRLDESDPDVKRAMIAAATGTADAVYGRVALPSGDAVGTPIDAGHEGPEEEGHVEGEFREQEEQTGTTPAAPAADPPIVREEEPSAPAAAANPMERMQEIADGLKDTVANLGKSENMTWSAEARAKAPSAKAYGLAGGSVAKALPWKLSDAHASLVRHAVMTFAAGSFESWDKLRSEHVSAVIDWAKSRPAEVREVVEFLLEHREDLKPVREAIAGQQTLPLK